MSEDRQNAETLAADDLLSAAESRREKCGTYAGYQAHVRYGETPCDDCRTANREYIRARRHASAEVRGREMQQHLARMRAWKRLADMYPAHFQALYDEESASIPSLPRKRRSDSRQGATR